ncbi:MAG: DMT family transporter [Paracoccaceae bacterium]|jgi:drug/metabolite transporter (DMT)-like permease|nr:DMT family transporter [Paracoccaceae bacterium]|tara:strand:- start:7719 stop:8588 length:870 start_codon:yes stop_codon:yes gene_type:complete
MAIYQAFGTIRDMRLFFLTTLVMTAFAANSVLARLAMVSNSIGPSNFAMIRVGSGALVLILLVLIVHKKKPKFKLNTIISGISLVCYLIGFSFAYLVIDTGVGALILFGGVQLVMFVGALVLKEKVNIVRFFGMFLAIVGLFILVDPRIGGNNLVGMLLMFIASLGWGLYSLLGRGQKSPLSSTSGNFIVALILMIPFALFIPDKITPNSYGLFLAIISGSITSGIGYAVWYWVLPKINIMTASVAQLTVPLIAAFGGYLFIYETLNWQFYISSILILGGVLVPFIYKR